MSETRSRLAARLRSRRAHILERWHAMADADPALTTASRMTRPQFNDHIPGTLDALDRALRTGAESADGGAAGDHGSQRWQQGYGLDELVREFGHLHICLMREVAAFAASDAASDPAEVSASRELVALLIHSAVTASVLRFHELQRADAAGRVRALEAALAELGVGEKARGEALRAASHDLRGGLSIVSNSAALLGTDRLTATQRQDIAARLQRGLRSLTAMLNDLADLSRLEAGQERRVVTTFDAGRTLSDLCAAARGGAEAKGIVFEARGPASLRVEGDDGMVRRLAQNLIVNAVKYTAQGGVTVTWGEAHDDLWEFSISDTGPGLTAGSAAPLAEEIRQATKTARAIEAPADAAPPLQARAAPGAAPAAERTVEAGEGIGLSIVKRLCELLDASLELDTAAGRGSSFRVRLPRAYETGPTTGGTVSP